MLLMKKLLLFLFTVFTVLISQAEKRQTPFLKYTWYAVDRIFASTEEFRSSAPGLDPVDISSFVISGDNLVRLHTIIEAPSNPESKLFIEIENKNPIPTVMIDGQPISNLRQDVSFTSEITTIDGKEELLLTLIIDSKATKGVTLTDYFKGMYLSTVSGISIAWCEPVKDPFFGGYMVVIHVQNLTQHDIDGKLKAHITDAFTYEIVAENNNCAFTRSSSEAVIDINFPEAKDKLKEGKYFVEVSLVDKEKNEEVVDQLITPIWLN
jgi:hypothetical protein